MGLLVTTPLRTRYGPAGGFLPGWQHEPPGFTPFLDSDFAAFPTADGWFLQGDQISVVTDPTAPLSPTHKVVQWFYNGPTSPGAGDGFADGSAPGEIYNDTLTGVVSEYFMGGFFKFSSGFANHPVGTKMWYPFGNADFIVDLSGGGLGPAGTVLIAAQPVGAGDDYNLPGQHNFAISFGAWHKLELHFIPGTPSGGTTFHWWIDEIDVGNYTNEIWPSPFTGLWQEWRWNPTYGGFGGYTCPADSWFWVDHTYLSRP